MSIIFKDNNQKYQQEVVLDIIREEYDKEKQTTISLDNKAGIFLSALAVIGTVWLQILPMPEIINLFIKNSFHMRQGIIILFMAITLVIFIANIFCLLKCLSLRAYYSVNILSLINNLKQEAEIVEYQDAIIDHFTEIITHNIKMNENKSAYFRKSTYLLVIYVILSLLTFFVVSFII